MKKTICQFSIDLPFFLIGVDILENTESLVIVAIIKTIKQIVYLNPCESLAF